MSPRTHKTRIRSSLSLLLVVVLLFAAQAFAGERKADPSSNVPSVRANLIEKLEVVGTAIYDNDTPFGRDGTDGGTVGNRFSPNMTHSIATVSFAVAGNYATSMVMTVWDVNPASVVVLQRQLVSGIPQSPATTGRFSAALTAAVVGHTGDFIAGLRNTDYDACAGNTGLGSTCDGVALTQGTAPAPPAASRGARVNFTSGAFVPLITNVASTGQALGANAIFRATGDNLPVELMQFGIE